MGIKNGDGAFAQFVWREKGRELFGWGKNRMAGVLGCIKEKGRESCAQGGKKVAGVGALQVR